MSKRQASEALDELRGVDSPASKRSRYEGSAPADSLNGSATPGPADDDQGSIAHQGGRTRNSESRGGDGDEDDEGDDRDRAEDQDQGEDEDADEPPIKAPLRQSAPTEGYDDLYLDTIDRQVLDFDFEKLCSISLSNINVYACLVCGRYYQGRGPKSHAYFHALNDDHHVFINMHTARVYVLPEGYEVLSKSLDDIRYVSDPRYTREHVSKLDREPAEAWTLQGRPYAPGYVGINNIKDNDYVNVVVQALSHVAPLRNFFLLEDLDSQQRQQLKATPAQVQQQKLQGDLAELVRRTALLFRKIWNPRAFKNHVSPHELLQEVALRSNKRFTLTTQADPVDFLFWFLNHLHLGLGGSRSKPGSSIVQRIFQGRLRVESQAITASSAQNPDGRLRFEEAAHVTVDIQRFLLLTLDLPPAPLFQDDLERNIIPQVPLTTLLHKYDGVRTQEHRDQRKRYRLMHPLPPYLVFHVKRFSTNKFVSERNPTIVTFDARLGLDVSPYVEPDPTQHPPSEAIWYDLAANVVHEAVRASSEDAVADSASAGAGGGAGAGAGGSSGSGGAAAETTRAWKVQLRDRATGEWRVCQDLFVEPAQKELLYLGESYLQIWERRREPKGKGKAT